MPSNPKIAWLSPLPPQRSGIANYSYWLVKELRNYFQIDLYYDGEAPAEELQKEFEVYPLSVFSSQHESYDEVIYHLGNHSEFHKRIYELAWNFPGTIVLHDYNLIGFMHEAFYRQNDELFRQALFDGLREQSRNRLQTFIGRLNPEIPTHPMSQAIVSRSKKVVVHHRWVKKQFVDNEHIEVIPMFAKLNYRPTQEEIKIFKAKLGIRDSAFVVCCLGFVNTNKLPAFQVDVVQRLIDDGYPLQLIFVGEPSPDVRDLATKTRAGRYREDILFTGYVDETDYFSAIFASDVITNLRNPSMGEGSLTLMQALAAAKPTIVSDINQYQEFPDRVCWKLTHDENQADVLYAYIAALLSDPALRRAISQNCAEYVNTVFSWEKIIGQWKESISRGLPQPHELKTV